MKLIFHIDVNSAFLSWTACGLLEKGGADDSASCADLTQKNTSDPASDAAVNAPATTLPPTDIREIASVIGGSEKSRHGIVLAKSTLAKQYGIVTGEPLFQARRKCPGLVVVPPNYQLYVRKSDQLIRMLHEYTPLIQQYSIDEAWMDMTGIQEAQADPVGFATRLKDRIHRELGFTVNIGISVNHLLAKMGSELRKPDRVHTLFPEEIPQKMWPLPIGELFMAGKSSVKALNNLGIRTIGELAASDPKLITLNLKSHGTMLWNYANGIDNSPVCSTPAEAKGIGNSTTLSCDLTKECEAVPILHSLAESVASRLRKAHKKAGSICVEIKYYDFQSVSRQTQIDIPTNSTDLITQTSKRLFHELWNQQPVRLLGIRTTKLVDENEPVQLSLFDLDFSDISANKTNANADFPKKPSPEKQKKLDAALDSIRKKYGKKAVTRASEME